MPLRSLTWIGAVLGCAAGDPAPPPAAPADTLSTPTDDTAMPVEPGDSGEPPPVPDACGTLLGVQVVGGSGLDSTQDLAVAADGSWLVGGYFQGPVTFGAGTPAEVTLIPTGLADGLLARYAADGTFQWATHLATPYSAAPEAVFATSDGGAVVVGFFYEALTLAPGTPEETAYASLGESDGFIARFDADGTLRWSTRIGGPGADFAIAGGVLADDSVMFAGLHRADAVFGAGEPLETTLFLPPLAFEAGFVAALAPDGSLAWAQPFGGTQYAAAYAGKVDVLAQQLVLTGNVSGPGLAVFGAGQPGEVVVDPDGNNSFLARWAGDGTLGAVATMLGASSAALDVGGDGSVVVTGSFDDAVTFGPGEANETVLATEANEAVFVSRHAVDGSLLWAVLADAEPRSNAVGRGITAMPDGGAVVTGDFTESIRFDPGGPAELSFQTAGGYDPYAARFEASGALRCAVHIAGTGTDLGADARLLPDGTVLLTGNIDKSAQFSAGLVDKLWVSAEKLDGFLATYWF